MWILGSFGKDLLFLFLPGFLGFFLSAWISPASAAFLPYAFLTLAIVDSGHVYTTAWRTWLHPEERAASPRYWAVPLAVFLLLGSWHFSGLPHLWAFVVYATLFHHVRQFYGFSKWYQKLNGKYSCVSDAFLYLLSLAPIVLYHFRPGASAEYYSDADLFLMPDASLFRTGLWLYGGILAGWITFELSEIYRNGFSANRFLSVFTPAAVYGGSFLWMDRHDAILFPLLLSHGMAYFAVMEQTLRRTRPRLFPGPTRALLAILATAILFGAGEHFLDLALFASDDAYAPAPGEFLRALFVGAYLTPLLSHYLFDAVIWRGHHREAKAIFARAP